MAAGSRLLWAIALVAGAFHGALAHLSMVCSSSSTSLPDQITLWFITYAHNQDHTQVPGTLVISSPTGETYRFAFTNVCTATPPYLIGPTEVSTDRFTQAIKDECSDLVVNGRPVVDDNTVSLCYRNAPSGLLGRDMQIAVPEPRRDVASNEMWKDYGFGPWHLEMVFMYSVMIENVVPGWYVLTTENTNQVIEPCSDTQHPCNIGYRARGSTDSAVKWFPLVPAMNGAPCLTQPTAAQVANTNADAAILSRCVDVPAGTLCPVMCNDGFAQQGVLYCDDGSWSDAFGCKGPDRCDLPRADNSWFLEVAGVSPVGVLPDFSSRPYCGIISDIGAVCHYSCSNPTYWGRGWIVCITNFDGSGSGMWMKESEDTACEPPDRDQPPPPPKITSIATEGVDSYRVKWEDGSVNLGDRSPNKLYDFNVIPSGSLSCPDMNGHYPPPDGLLCTGALDGTSYQIQVRAHNMNHAGAWSEFVTLGCAGPPTLPATQMYLQSCSGRVDFGQYCSVTCADGLVGNSADYLCSFGPPPMYRGVLPVCLEQAKAPVVYSVTATSTTSLEITWLNQGLGSIGAEADPDGYICDKDTRCTGTIACTSGACSLRNIESTDKCAQLCNAEPSCELFVYEARSKGCELFATLITETPVSAAERMYCCKTTEGTDSGAPLLLNFPAEVTISMVNDRTLCLMPLGGTYASGASLVLGLCTEGEESQIFEMRSDTTIVMKNNIAFCLAAVGGEPRPEVGDAVQLVSPCDAQAASQRFEWLPDGSLGSEAVPGYCMALPSSSPQVGDAVSLAACTGDAGREHFHVEQRVFFRSNPLAEWKVELRGPSGVWFAPDGCTGLTEPCLTRCTAQNLPPGASYEVVVRAQCDTFPEISSPFSDTAYGETLPVVATAPTAVVVSNIDASSATVQWTPGTANNCTFKEWQVELQSTQHTFAAHPAECNNLNVRAETTCVLTNLPCGTHFAVRVSEKCRNDLASSVPSVASDFSTSASGGQCLKPINAPTIDTFERSAFHFLIRWTVPTYSVGDPGYVEHDCQFSSFQVRMQLSNTAEWKEVFGCTNLLQWTVRDCVAQGFLATSGVQNTRWAMGNYRAHVFIECQDTRTNSPASLPSQAQSPLPRSSAAPVLTAASPTRETYQLTWTLPNLEDCVFSKYQVELEDQDAGSGYVASPQGCGNLASLCITTCTLRELSTNTRYSARIQVVCTDPLANSTLAEQSPSPVTTDPEQQAAPASTQVSALTANSGTLEWTPGLQSPDCTFQEWNVEFQADGALSWASASGCMSLMELASTSCDFTSLSCDTVYRARIRQVCALAAATSEYRVTSTFRTLKSGSCLRAAAPPEHVALASPTTTSLSLTWSAGNSYDCVFGGFEVQLQPEASAQWEEVYVGSCAGKIFPLSSGSCSLQDLQPDTQYLARVRHTCTVGSLDSGWSTSVEAGRTMAVPEISLSTSLPLGRVTESRPTSLTAIFDTNVQLNLNAIDPATYGWAEQCGNEGSLCTCVGTVYFGKRYANGATGGSENTFAQMIAAGGYQVAPANGPTGCRADCDPGPPRGLCLAPVDTSVSWACWCEAPQQPQPRRLLVCPASSDPLPNSCGCTGSDCLQLCLTPPAASNGVHLLNPQILWYNLGQDVRVGSGCQYQVTIEEGYLKTWVEPAKRSAEFSWTFTYDPPKPQLSMTLVDTGPTSLTLAASWDMPTNFTCAVSSVSTSNVSATYVGPTAVQFVLDGLVPSSSFGVSCSGHEVGDVWNTVVATAGPFMTSPDSNALLASITVTSATACTDSDPPIFHKDRPLTPPLEPTDAGGFYQTRIDVSGFRTECGYPDSVHVTPAYIATIQAMPQSEFATVTYQPRSREIYLDMVWQAGTPPTGTTSMNFTVDVQPFTGSGQTTNRYIVEVTALFGNLQARAFRGPSLIKSNDFNAVEIDITVELGIDTSSLAVWFGDLEQRTTIGLASTREFDGHLQQFITLTVSNAIGFGTDLPVTILLQGITYPSSFIVSFEREAVLGRNGLPMCPLPDQTNNAGISGLAGMPNAIVPLNATPSCGDPYSETPAECGFLCSAPGGWGFGRLVCNQGTWTKRTPSTGCHLPSEDSPWYAPVLTGLFDEGGGTMRVMFTWQNDGSLRSDPIHFGFDVVPGGTLICPNYVGAVPPNEGVLCDGGDANRMGQYMIKVQAVNQHGPGAWSNAMQRACLPLQVVPESDAWRYNTSECITLIDGQTCQVSCMEGTVQAVGPTLFACNPPDQPSGSWPQCYKQAARPVNVRATGSSATSLAISWTDGGLNDCGGLVPFVRWRVQLREVLGQWVDAQGCLFATNLCTTDCEAIGLQSNTAYEARVSAECGRSEVSSPPSAVSSPGRTRPRAAGPPTNLQTVLQGTTTMAIRWEASPDIGDCIFQNWLVERRGPSGTWKTNPDGCDNLLNGEELQCTLVGLVCDTNYEFRVAYVCTDAFANSPMSSPTTGRTSDDGSCLIPAGSPTQLTGIALSPSTIVFSWLPGTSNDCTFQSWQVRISRFYQGSSSGWMSNIGCENLLSREPPSCTAVSLVRGTYTFYVAEQCTDPQANSELSEVSPPVTPPLTAAEAPTEVRAQAARADGFLIQWQPGALNDCTFGSFEVEIQLMGESTWSTPTGCDSLVDVCTAQCEVSGALSNSNYIAQVRVTCQEEDASSRFSEPSAPILTLPLPAPKPMGLTASSPTLNAVDLSWTAPEPSPDCIFLSWEVGVLVETQSQWSTPAGCDTLLLRSASQCTAQGLSCDTAYTARVREVCTLGAATSPYAISASFRTLKIGNCLYGATAPQYLRASSPTTTTLTLAFVAGTANDCVFAGFDVQRLQVGTSDWVDVGGSCDSIATRAGPVCVAEGLTDGTAFLFRAREVCSNGEELASPWGVTAEAVATIAVQEVTIVAEIPKGAITETRPTSLLVVFDVNVILDTQESGPKLRICPLTELEVPNSCGCVQSTCENHCVEPPTAPTGVGSFVNLVNPQVLSYTFGSSFAPGTHCTYLVELESGLLMTETQPRKLSPVFQWSFTYSPLPPVLTLNLVRSTTTSLTFSVLWDTFATFNCSIVSGTRWASGTYTGTQPAEIELTGLVPSTAYIVECTGTMIQDSWNSGTERRGTFITADDTDSRFRSLHVSISRQCNVGGPLGPTLRQPLSPAFDSEQVGAQHVLYADLSSFREECGIGADMDTTARYVATMEASAQSDFAHVTFAPPSRTATLELRWPRGADVPPGVDATMLTGAVFPHTGGSAFQNRVAVQIILLFTNLKAGPIRPPTRLKPGVSSAEMDITMELGVDLPEIYIRIGNFAQQTVHTNSGVVTVGGRQQQQMTLSVAAVTGYGANLPVYVVAGGMAYPTSSTVSFEEADVIGRNGLPVCYVPDAANNAGIDDARAGHPNRLRPTIPMPNCGSPYSETFAACSFYCSQQGAWGFGKIVCREGIWEKQDSTAACYLPGDDSLWHAPTITALEDRGSGAMRVHFTFDNDGSLRSAPTHFAFDVVPSGTLSCPDYEGETAPENGAMCQGGDEDNMGQYIIKVRAVNLAGSGAWSNAMQRACRSLEVRPVTEQWRYEVSNCADLLDGQTCQVTCTPETVQVDLLPILRCIAPDQPTGSLPKCYKRAWQPVNVALESLSDSSVRITWTDGGLNDCGTLVPFVRWKVEVMAGSTGRWYEPQGCAAYSKCETLCDATGLVSNTVYQARISALCARSEVNSPVSASGEGTTLPTVAEPPANVRMTTPGSTTMSISWSASNEQGDCVFQRWEVELRGPSGTWSSNPDGCQILDDFATAVCTLIGLSCATNYDFRVAQICADSRANSVVSRLGSGTTIRDGQCLIPADQPTDLMGLPTSPTTVVLSWTVGRPNDCNFKSWLVQIRRTHNGVQGGWVTNPGCEALVSRQASSCTATGLLRGTYHFYVVEECMDSRANSQISRTSPPITPPLTPAQSPANVEAEDPEVHSFHITWDARALHDCTFSSFLVEVQIVGTDSWTTPLGCDALISACVTDCLARDVSSNSHYVARVKVMCDESTAASPYSELSESILTLPMQAGRPAALRSASPTSSSVDLEWVAATPSPDCTFRNWDLGVLMDTYSQWSTPSGCDMLGTRSTTRCTAMGLACDTAYTVRVREVCSLSGATGDFLVGAQFRTLRSGTCLRGATAPEFVRMSSPTTTSLLLTFMAGVGHDCIFGGFDVQRLQVGTAMWVNAGGSCRTIATREGPRCTAQGLRDGTPYIFRVREMCTNGGALASPWGISGEATSTIEVPPVTVVAKVPAEGFSAGARPDSLLVVFAVNVELVLADGGADAPGSLQICPATDEEMPNSCGCTGARCAERCLIAPPAGQPNSIALLNPQVLWYSFGEQLIPGSYCNYTVSLGEGMVTTEMTPSKPSPAIQWSFQYAPQRPLLDLTLVSSTTTSVKLAASWSEPTRFNCSIAAGATSSASGEYTGNGPVEILLSNLVPSTGYEVDCTGTAIQDVWNSASYRQGIFRTAADTNSRLRWLRVAVRAKCNADAEPSDASLAELIPDFDASKAGTAHTVRIDVSSFRTDCRIPDNQAAVATYITQLSAVPESSFASVVYSPDDGTEQLDFEWPANTARPLGRVIVNMSTAVYPHTGGSSLQNRYSIRVIAMFANVKVVAMTQSANPLPVDGSESMTVTVRTELGVRPDSINIRIGSFLQAIIAEGTEQFQDETGEQIQQIRFSIPAAVGVGFELPIIALLQSLSYQSTFNVSFVRPIISTVSATMVGGNFGTEASLLADSEVVIRGDSLAIPANSVALSSGVGAEIYIVGVPPDCITLACQLPTVQAMRAGGTDNLCGPTDVQYSSTAGVKPQLLCELQPSVNNPIAIAVIVRRGGDEMVLGALADPQQAHQKLAYLPPTPTEISHPTQNISSSDPFIIFGDGFPGENITQAGFMQLWGTSESDPPLDPSNPGPGFLPLCATMRRLSAGELECVRFQNWNAGTLRSTRPRIWVQVGPNLVSSEALSNAMAIPQLEIAEINRTDAFEVGPMLIIFRGANFGEDVNGDLNITIESDGNETISEQERRRLEASASSGDEAAARRLAQVNASTAKEAVQCKTTFRSSSEVRCEIEGSLFGTQLGDDEYEKELVDPETLHEYPVASSVKFGGIFAGQTIPEGSEPLGTSFSFQVKLFQCGMGERRINASARGCVACTQGTFKNFTGAAMRCLPCEQGRYADLEGMVECRTCAEGFTTSLLGALTQSACTCARGYFKDLTNPDPGPHGTGWCLECPEHAICEGGDAQPYSMAGYWSLDERRFWECYPTSACLQGNVNSTNVCESGRKPDSRRCVACATGFYRYHSGCYECAFQDRTVAFGGPFLIVVVLLACVVPKSVRAYHKERTLDKAKKPPDQKKKPQKRKQLPTADDHWAFRFLPAEKWPWALKRLTAENKPVHRLVVLAFNRLQLIWALGNLPCEWPEIFLSTHTNILSVFAFDVDILRPECIRNPASGFKDYFEMAYLLKFLTQWSAPFMVFVIIASGIRINCWLHPDPGDRRFIHFQSAIISTISAQALLQLMSHLYDNLYFVRCMRCEDNIFCMVDNPLLQCGSVSLFGAVDQEWLTIAVVSVMDLAFISIPLVSFIFWSIWKSWIWQHGIGSGVNPGGNMPWFMALSEFWVCNYKGYSTDLRLESNELRELMRKHIWGRVNPRDVWDHCVHSTNFERWKVVGRTLQHHVNAVVNFIEIQREHNVRQLQEEQKRAKHHHEAKQLEALIRVKQARIDLAMQQRRHHTAGLQEHLHRAQIFIKEVEGGISPFEPDSLFWTYSWECALLMQKIFVIVIAMVSPPDAGTVVLAGAFFFMLVVLISGVSMEPHQWEYLNTLELVMDVLTLYLIIFAQLQWDTPVIFVGIGITVVTMLPVAIRTILPSFPEDAGLLDETGPSKRKSHFQHSGSGTMEQVHSDEIQTLPSISETMAHVRTDNVKTAIMASALNNKGSGSLTTIQRLMKHKVRLMKLQQQQLHEDDVVDLEAKHGYDSEDPHQALLGPGLAV